MRLATGGLLLASLSCFGADLQKLPAETMSLIDSARSAPPEFSADVLLRLAASPAIVDPAWKRRLIEDAFSAGAHAQLPYQKRGEATTDARASRAFWKNGLDSLTLQTRAVEAMLALDSQRARVLFESIAIPEVPDLTCRETGAPDVSAYYQTAGNVFGRGFTTQQREKLEDLHFLGRIIGSLQSPAHVTPAVKLIYTARLTPEQRQELVTVFAGMLARVNSTPRVFWNATWQLVPVSAPVRLPVGVNAAPPLLPSVPGQLPPAVLDGAPTLVPALRSYIVRHVSGPRCSEDINEGKLPGVVNDFNLFASMLDASGTLYQPITPEEAKPAKDDGTFERHWWWESGRSKQVLLALKWLNHGNRDLPDDKRFFTLEERQSSDWRAHFVDTVKLIEGWREDEEDSPDDWFGMVSESYALLAEKVPPGTDRDGAIDRFLNFMETHYASVESHNFWFTQLHGMWSSKDSAVVQRFQESKNPVIALYAKVGAISR